MKDIDGEPKRVLLSWHILGILSSIASGEFGIESYYFMINKIPIPSIFWGFMYAAEILWISLFVISSAMIIYFWKDGR